MANLIYKGLKANLPAAREANSFYLCTDSRELFFGESLYNEAVQFYTDTKPTAPAQGTLYIDSDTGSGDVWNGTAWVNVVKPVNTAIVDGADDTTVPTSKAVKDYVDGLDIAEYTVEKAATAESGYVATYYLAKDGTQAGASINIPKDFLVKSAEIKEVETADTPYTGAAAGDKYIDFVINSKDGDDTESHIYLPVQELVDAYTAGDGIDISSANVVSVKVDTANANGLGVTGDGLKLDAATAATAGAMSAADKTNLDDVVEKLTIGTF